VDTVIHTFLVVDSTLVRPRTLHEINVIGTMNLLAAAGASGSPVRHVVMKSSSLVYGSSAEDPNTFHEDTPRSGPARTRVERSLLEAESLVRDFAVDNPATTVTVLRFANVLGTDIVTAISKNLSRPLCPSILGYDPLVQFVEEDDVVRALEFVTREEVPGIYNVAGEGRLPWSEVAALCGTRLLPLPPFRPSWALGPLVRLGVYGLPPELEALLRYGRGLDTSRLAAAGFHYRYTSAGTVRNFVRAARLRRGAGREPASYTYEHDVEQFFRHSRAVVHSSDG
jgi:UDP-glucose 4-epimerase